MVEYRKPAVTNAVGGIWAVRAEPNVSLRGVEIQGTIRVGFGSYMNRGLIRGYSRIGRYCSIGRDVSIGLGIHNLSNSSTSPFFNFRSSVPSKKFVSVDPKIRTLIGNDVWIGDGVKIDSGVTVGDGAIIATGAIVTKDVEPYSIVGGIPAKHLKWRFPEEIRTAFQELRWWESDPDELQSWFVADPQMCIENAPLLQQKADFPTVMIKSKRVRNNPRREAESS